MIEIILGLVLLCIVIGLGIYFSPKRRIKRKAEKFVRDNQEDILRGCLSYAKAELTYKQYSKFREIFENKLATGGMSLGAALRESIDEAKMD
jgi:hypothetical protein